jgi:hypothetical protein
MSQPIYVVKVVRLGGNTRNWGFYYDAKVATQALAENWTDAFELGYYKYGIVLECQEGLLQTGVEVAWFEWIDTTFSSTIACVSRPVEFEGYFFTM